MAKIAAELELALKDRAASGAPGRAASRLLAQGDGWSVSDVLCTSGPQDRAFEERHHDVSLAIVAYGTFQYRSTRGGDLMTPGSLLLGNAGERFECRHDHAAGDRCVSFKYAPDYFDRLAAEAGAAPSERRFRISRVPPLRALAPIIARACALVGARAWGVRQGGRRDALGAAPRPDACAEADLRWEELGRELAVLTVQLACGLPRDLTPVAPAAAARVTRAVRDIERRPDSALRLESLARAAGLSPYHFLRMFERVTDLSPHQFVLRTRLREAAIRLTRERSRIAEIAFDCGFGDVSNFNRAFRREFGASPREHRRRTQ